MSIDKTSYSAKEKAFSRLIKVYENGKFIEKEFLITNENPCCGTDEYSSFSLTEGLRQIITRLYKPFRLYKSPSL